MIQCKTFFWIVNELHFFWSRIIKYFCNSFQKCLWSLTFSCSFKSLRPRSFAVLSVVATNFLDKLAIHYTQLGIRGIDTFDWCSTSNLYVAPMCAVHRLNYFCGKWIEIPLILNSDEQFMRYTCLWHWFVPSKDFGMRLLFQCPVHTHFKSQGGAEPFQNLSVNYVGFESVHVVWWRFTEDILWMNDSDRVWSRLFWIISIKLFERRGSSTHREVEACTFLENETHQNVEWQFWVAKFNSIM